MDSSKDRLRVGSITKPHGLKGAVKVYPVTDDPGCFTPGNRLFIETKGADIPVTVKSSSPFKNLYILTFEEFERIEDVEEYRSADITINRADASELAENEYFVSDLIGMTVSEENGNVIGILDEVIETGANDVYSIKREGKKNLLVPAIKDCILNVDIPERLMTVRLLAGLE